MRAPGWGWRWSRGLPSAHGGSVSLASTPGVGSQFTVTLPWQPGTVSARPPAQPGRLSSALGGGRLVTVADDNEETREILSEYLAFHGFSVMLARNGRELLVRLSVQRPAVLLLDMQMPVIDGLAALRQIRADPALAGLPVVVLSAFAMSADQTRALAAGASAFLSKPVVLANLVQTISSLADAPPP